MLSFLVASLQQEVLIIIPIFALERGTSTNMRSTSFLLFPTFPHWIYGQIGRCLGRTTESLTFLLYLLANYYQCRLADWLGFDSGVHNWWINCRTRYLTKFGNFPSQALFRYVD
jgi:hypothetical protein